MRLTCLLISRKLKYKPTVEVRTILRTVPPLIYQNTKISKILNYQNSTKIGLIKEVITDLKLQEHLNIITTIKKYKCNRSTLLKYYNGIYSSR